MQMFQPIQNPFLAQIQTALKNSLKEQMIAAGLEWSEQHDERVLTPIFNELTGMGILEFKRVEVVSSSEENDIKTIELLINQMLLQLTIRREVQIASIKEYYEFLEDNGLREDEYSMEEFLAENEIDASQVTYGIRASFTTKDIGDMFLNASKMRNQAKTDLANASIVIEGLSEIAALLEEQGYTLSADGPYYSNTGSDYDPDEDEDSDDDDSDDDIDFDEDSDDDDSDDDIDFDEDDIDEEEEE